jgi:ABC-type multidrug transport system ATPase subunit
VILVSHNPVQLQKLCTRVIWFEKGKLLMDGNPKTVITAYKKFCDNTERWLRRHLHISCVLETDMPSATGEEKHGGNPENA